MWTGLKKASLEKDNMSGEQKQDMRDRKVDKLLKHVELSCLNFEVTHNIRVAQISLQPAIFPL